VHARRHRPATIAALQRAGCKIDSGADWRKGTVLEARTLADTITRATVWPPPA
jgi:hypothetical protein